MRGITNVHIPVYLVRRVVRDGSGSEVRFSERRLLRQSADDRVIAVIEAPRGTRIRYRPDQHGQDQLLVPRDESLLGRMLGHWIAIPVKYVLSDARWGSHGLRLLPPPSQSGSTGVPSETTLEVAR